MTKILVGEPLFDLCRNIEQLNGDQKSYDATNVLYESKVQNALETVLTHDAIMLIANNGGDVEGYLMIAEIPYHIDGVSIYNVEVPEGLKNRTIKITDGTQVIERVKNLSQWCDSTAEQIISDDCKSISLNTKPQDACLTAKEIKIFVDVLEAKLFTLTEFNSR